MSTVCPSGCRLATFVWVLGALAAGCERFVDPAPDPEPLAARAISAGHVHTCALDEEGTAFCWGSNTSGQLGRRTNGPTDFNPTPVRGHLFASIDAGAYHTCAVGTDGRGYCWGTNNQGQLGAAGLEDVRHVGAPVEVAGDHRFQSLSAGTQHSCGIEEDGRPLCWGLSRHGENGRPGDSTVTVVPQPVETDVLFTQVSVGLQHTCALAVDGQAYCWGLNRWGQLGAEGVDQSPVPVPVNGPPFVSITAGGVHTCGLTANGEAYCWGRHRTLALGTDSRAGCTGDVCPTPLRVDGGHVFRDLAAGHAHTCGVTSDARAFCWGSAESGAIGNCEITPYWSTPQPVCGGVEFDRITGGSAHSCGLATSGAAWCWGANDDYQLGSVALTSFGPRQVVAPTW